MDLLHRERQRRLAVEGALAAHDLVDDQAKRINVTAAVELVRLAREHDALLYIDDAHGFGVIGERAPDELCHYGKRGNGVVRNQGEDYEHIVLVGGFSKAYSSLLSFLALPTRLKDVLKVAAPPYLFSGPSPIASLATTLAGLAVNEKRGEWTNRWNRTIER